MSTITRSLILWATIAATVAGCRDEAADKSERQRLVITGSSTLAPLVAEIGKRFEASHPSARIDVQTGGSARGIADVRQGLADVGMVSRALKADEGDLRAFAVARDGVCVIVHASNAIRALTDRQVIGVYTGRLDNWKALGGADAPITVVNKAAGRATLEVFLKHFGLSASAIDADLIAGDNEQVIKTVAGDPNAIGYVSIGTAEYHVRAGAPLTLCPGGGVAATTANLANGSFPISRALNLVTRDQPEGLSRSFIAFCRSPEVHDLIRELYFVPIE